MKPVNKYFETANSKVMTAYEQSGTKIKEILGSVDGNGVYDEYFAINGEYLLGLMAHSIEIQDEAYFTENTFEALQMNNRGLYQDILGDAYDTSYVNPAYSVERFGKRLGGILSAVAFLWRDYVGLCYEQRFSDMYRLNQLYIRLFDVLSGGKTEAVEVKTVVRDTLLEDIDQYILNEWVRKLTPQFNAYNHIASDNDLSDLRYLFRYGLYVDQNEIESAKYVLSLPQEKIDLIADTYTEAFFRGFERENIPLEPKRSVQVTYQLGWERFVKKAYENFAKLDMKPIVHYALQGAQRPRMYNTKPNRQMEYDHRFSNAIYFDATYVEALERANAKALEQLEADAEVFAGPALFEVFGQAPFKPRNKESNLVYSDEQRDLKTKYDGVVMAEYRKYVRGDNYSFTINDYPLPSIGSDYEAIFQEVIEVNTLDQAMYERIQGYIIDALDQSEYAHILGALDNETDLKVALHPINDPEKETKFNNCTADVNVPVGEVFTTPQLAGTNGLLHVKDVYLKGLQYLDLKIWFEDGMISKYDCSNFDTEEENKKYVHETLIHPHDSLPLGEFAIGTNTVAYMMAKKYNINSILPILIGEKTGPHFAIGDSCYTWSEDKKIYNSNGKEIIAKDNAVSLLRKTDISKAYKNKHTDITIPYNELGSIIGYNSKGDAFKIIENSRFALKGTEALNEPLDRASVE